MTTPDRATRTAGAATALYTYAFVAAGADLPAGLTGVGPQPSPVGVVGRDGLGLLVSDVDSTWLARLRDDDVSESGELAIGAQRHDRVVRAAFERAAVLPFRFGTVLRDRAAADRLLTEQHDQALALLAHVRDRVEWGVRIRGDLDGPSADTAAAGDAADTPADRSSGAAYLASRRRRLDARDRRRDRARDAAAALAAELTELVADTADRSGRNALVDVAVLVDRRAERDFLAQVDRLAGRATDAGLVLDVTGPWPPYSFARATWEVGDG